MPCNYKDYPENFKEIRAAILERAGYKCEKCGLENYAVGYRDAEGTFHPNCGTNHTSILPAETTGLDWDMWECDLCSHGWLDDEQKAVAGKCIPALVTGEAE